MNETITVIVAGVPYHADIEDGNMHIYVSENEDIMRCSAPQCDLKLVVAIAAAAYKNGQVFAKSQSRK